MKIRPLYVLLVLALLPLAVYAAITFRQGTAEDAKDLAKTHFLCWQGTYKGILPDKLNDEQTEESFLKYWDNYFASGNGNSSFVILATEDNKILGFAAAGPTINDSEFTKNHDGELYKLYISPLAQRGGLGTMLLKKTQEKLKELGYKKMVIKALKENKKAYDFYTKQGGVALGYDVFTQEPLTHKIYFSFNLA